MLLPERGRRYAVAATVGTVKVLVTVNQVGYQVIYQLFQIFTSAPRSTFLKVAKRNVRRVLGACRSSPFRESAFS